MTTTGLIPLLYQAIDKVKTNKASAIKINEKNLVDFADILGDSPLIKEAIKVAKRISPTDANVLLLGETGTGKEVFANAIHAGSNVQKNLLWQLIAVLFRGNCWKANYLVIRPGLTPVRSKIKRG